MKKSKSFRAALVIPVDQPPIENGVVVVSDGRVVSIEKANSITSATSQKNLIDLGDVALVPALVNAHTHLEFSHLDRPLGNPGMDFTQWIREVLKSRSAASSTLGDKQSAIQLGMAESYRAGVGCIGEIATPPLNVDYDGERFFRQGRHMGGSLSQMESCHSKHESEFPTIQTVVFQEQLGRADSQLAEKLSSAAAVLSKPGGSPAGVMRGISPHAPYSVHPQLLDGLCELANRQCVPVAMHLAETMAERELLDHQSGPFVGLLTELGVWNSPYSRMTQTIFDVLKSLAGTPRSLVIHGNYLSDDEIAFIANRRARMSVVYCPRTHHYFRHQQYPLEKMIGAGAVVAIGTDSRASNPDLNLFSELRFVAEGFPQLKPLEILRLGTLNGAIALGVNDRYGSITLGKRAMLSQIRLPEGESLRSGVLAGLFATGAVCERVEI